MIVNDIGEVLAFERADKKGSWQCPQGGCEGGESYFQCVLREIEQETGISRKFLKIRAVHPGLLAYEFPRGKRNIKKGRGQVQKWYVFRLLAGGLQSIHFNGHGKPEFQAYKWTTMEKLADKVVPFKRAVYEELYEHFAQHLSPTQWQ
ncbi:MAG: hypothetical protein A2849_01580 [Candidatus Taylorbacteria bacterium RIFCSPHIGHO2_01_FULL_51_15]|uniref:Nudix hydrolase domain-containing protein n=1 Tax=Candidatus Taylorbacteria bacterium RIFCSPHIGHO2_01_FULL_51_15 TaxID=1802304 RepID=A0A1G2MBB8_9BACT|nr:MAG: hypothetical protein A2849_01580 [Candidatus Taylorbacteria bacterium RIFCSPHIGHO2_01_FULL_51_15]